jgi:uncharacterized membrane protein affecting hemolysin expression
MRRSQLPLRTHHRRGAVLLVVLIVVLLILGMASSLFRLSLIQHKQARQFELQAQADWLARAGADRAAKRLAEQDFTQLTWKVELEELGPVEVVSRVVTSNTRPGFRRLETQVRLEPGFAHTPAHGYDTRTVGPSQNPRQDTP